MLKIKEFTVKFKDSEQVLVENVNFQLPAGEVHIMMGPNGAGKSSLAKALAGSPDYDVAGSIMLDNEELIKSSPDERSLTGLFLAHQSPIEVPGVKMTEFLRIAYNLRQSEDEKLDPWEFEDLYEAYAAELGISSDFSQRNLNEGFSGGEKKKSEVLQMLVLEPKYAILDEIDSGLDIDSLKSIFTAVRNFATENNSGVLMITHNPKILDFITPDKVYVLQDKTIMKSGDVKLAEQIIENGFRAEAE